MPIDLKGNTRIRIDQMTEAIVSGLKDRSRYVQNFGIYTEEFADGKTWVEYRLKRDQDTDSEFGRFKFFNQKPIRYSKKRIESSKKTQRPS